MCVFGAKRLQCFKRQGEVTANVKSSYRRDSAECSGLSRCQLYAIRCIVADAGTTLDCLVQPVKELRTPEKSVLLIQTNDVTSNKT